MSTSGNTLPNPCRNHLPFVVFPISIKFWSEVTDPQFALSAQQLNATARFSKFATQRILVSTGTRSTNSAWKRWVPGVELPDLGRQHVWQFLERKLMNIIWRSFSFSGDFQMAAEGEWSSASPDKADKSPAPWKDWSPSPVSCLALRCAENSDIHIREPSFTWEMVETVPFHPLPPLSPLPAHSHPQVSENSKKIGSWVGSPHWRWVYPTYIIVAYDKHSSTYYIYIYHQNISWSYHQQHITKITSLRMIPTMAFIHFLTGKSSGILSDISSGILSGISSGILSGKSSGILSDISSGILSGILSGISSGICSGILSDISSGISSGICSGISSGISSGILSGKSSGILSGILSDISSGILSGISSGILSGRWGPAVPTGLWSSRLRSGSAHCDLEVAVEVRQCRLLSGSRGWGPAVPTATWKSRLGSRGWGPAVPTGIWSSRWRSGSAHWDLELAVEVRLCPPGIWTARRTRRRWRRRRRRRRTALIKSNNPHLAGGEKIPTYDFSKCWIPKSPLVSLVSIPAMVPPRPTMGSKAPRRK